MLSQFKERPFYHRRQHTTQEVLEPKDHHSGLSSFDNQRKEFISSSSSFIFSSRAHVQDEVHHWLSLKMKRIFQRSRLSRSRSKGRIIETAFVSQTQSSTEDLDEVDRLANHPVLRPLDQWPEHRLRKSRSETGGSVDRGLAPWTGSSNHSSPVGVSSSIVGFGSRTVGVSMLTGPKRRAKKPVSRMKRSYTVDFAAAQADDVPVRRRPPSPTRQDSQDEYDEHDPVVVREPPPSNHLVTAIIETGCGQVNPRECITPPPNMHLMSSSTRRSNGLDCKKNNSSSIDEDISVVEAEISVQEATPPNTAPLPTKFGDRHQGNLLRMQLHKKYTNADCDTSSAASTTEVTSLLLPPKSEVVPPLPPPRFKLSLPLKHRLRMEAPSSQDDSSSTDSTPQRRKTPLNTKSRLLLSSSMMSSSPLKQSQDVITEEDPAAKISEVHHHRPRPAAPLLGRKHGPRPSSSSKRGPSSKFFLNLSGESESCSSAMSSMESVRSSNSDSVQSLVSSSESGAGCSMSSSQSNSDLSLPMSKPTLELRTHRSNILSSSKFQVLSPISDKSQEQSSEQGDSNSRTPKVSPTDHILTSCCGGANNHGDTDNNNVVQYNDNQVQHQVDPAPFAMPKLQRRLVEQQQKHEQYYQTSLLKRANSGIQGSDSGISMSSQDVQDMVELLQLPFDMPKLRRKTQHILSRPQSMPTTDNKTVSDSEAKVHHDLQQEDYRPASESNLEWPGPKPDITNGSTMDNYQYQATYRVAPTNFGGVLRSRPSGNFGAVVPTPPPPPGFADDNNQFYLTENNSEADMTTAGINPTMDLSLRRNRPKMVLSFGAGVGVDPKQKTLMFSTNSPFHLNDCQEIDPTLPLERQEWYHGAISRIETEDLLRRQEEGSYLVRNVDLHRQEFSLILKSSKGVMHMRIKRDASSREFQLSDFQRKFLTIPEMVHHYTRNRLPIKGAEHMCLKKPIAIQLL